MSQAIQPLLAPDLIMINLNSNNFAGTYTQSELDKACQLVDSEIYATPVFQNNTLAAYSEALMILETVSAPYRVKLSRHIAAAFKVNQTRLLDLHTILS
jgi:prophage tail gpP-like protein